MNELNDFWSIKLKQIKEIEKFKTDKELADFMNVSTVTVHDYIVGKNKQLKSENLRHLRRKGYSYDWLLDDIGDPKVDVPAELLKTKMADIQAINEEKKEEAKTETPIIVEQKQPEKTNIMEDPFFQYVQGESIFLRQLVTKLIINKD